MIQKIYRHFIRVILHNLPLIVFPKINVFLFRQLGYNIDYSTRIYSSSKIFGDIKVNIGKYTFIGNESVITGGDNGSIIIGENCDISDRVSIFCGTHEIDIFGQRVAGKGMSKNICIENGVWICYGALILPGVTIGTKSIVAAGSVVNKSVPPNVLVAGNPARVIKSLL